MDERLNAMRVAHRLAEKRVGRWRLQHFTQTAEKTAMDELKIRLSEPPERAHLAMSRLIPPGTYIGLQRRMIEQEVIDLVEEEVGNLDGFAEMLGMTREALIDTALPSERRWQTIMSDTPSELEGHEPTLEYHGKVLITGLGLGCVVAGLLANDDIERIDVIEIDPDVIELVAPYYDEDPRFHVWHASAIDRNALPSNLRWDFAWHDIWTHIAERNLEVETAEHGISYYRLFSVWDDRVGEQDAWALDDALEARRVNEEMRQNNIAWYAELEGADLDRQVEMLQNKVIWEKNPEFHGQDNDEVRRAFDPHGKLAEALRARLINEPEFLVGLKKIAAESLNESTPLGRPNEEASL